jgi:release factor glutamine methyltransferase
MNIAALLLEGRKILQSANVETAHLDCRLLAMEVLGRRREDLLRDSQDEVATEAAVLFRDMINRCASGEPVSRILGRREFWSLDFEVTPDVLDPRADTELIVETVLAETCAGSTARMLDLGTGSGCIPISVLSERPSMTAVAVDISPAAIEVANRNAWRHRVADRISFMEGCWFEPVSGSFDIIVSNPPYIPASDIDQLAPGVKNFDPRLALDGGADGLDPYRLIAAESGHVLIAGGLLVLEIGYDQGEAVAKLLESAGFSQIQVLRDLSGHDRTVVARLP